MAQVLPMMPAQQQGAMTQFQPQQQEQGAPGSGDLMLQALVKHLSPDPKVDPKSVLSNVTGKTGGYEYLNTLLAEGQCDCEDRTWKRHNRVSSGTATTTTGTFTYQFSVYEDKLKGTGETTGAYYESHAELGGAKFMYNDLQQVTSYPCSFSAKIVKRCNMKPVLSIEFLQNDEVVAVLEADNSYIELPPYTGGGAKFTRI